MQVRLIAKELRDAYSKIMEHTHYFDANSDEIELTSVDQVDWTGDQPLHVAARMNYVPEIHVLVLNGADVNARGERGLTPLHYAVLRKNVPAIVALMGHGASISAQDDEGRSVQDYAISAGLGKLSDMG